MWMWTRKNSSWMNYCCLYRKIWLPFCVNYTVCVSDKGKRACAVMPYWICLCQLHFFPEIWTISKQWWSKHFIYILKLFTIKKKHCTKTQLMSHTRSLFVLSASIETQQPSSALTILPLKMNIGPYCNMVHALATLLSDLYICYTVQAVDAVRGDTRYSTGRLQ